MTSYDIILLVNSRNSTQGVQLDALFSLPENICTAARNLLFLWFFAEQCENQSVSVGVLWSGVW